MTNVELVRVFYAAFDTNQPQLLDEVCSDDWKPIPAVPGNPGGLTGQKGTIGYLNSVFENLRYTVVELTDGGPDTVVARAQLAGNQIGEFLGVDPTGRKIILDTIEIHKIDSGKICQTYHLEDFWGAYQQMRAG